MNESDAIQNEWQDAAIRLQRLMSDAIHLLGMTERVPHREGAKPTFESQQIIDQLQRLWPNLEAALNEHTPEVSDLDLVTVTLVRIVEDLIVQIARTAVCMGVRLEDIRPALQASEAQESSKS